MKLSEFQTGSGPREDEEKLPYPRSSLAEPPITAAEARAATEANCRFHNGLIGHSPTANDRYGNVYLCGAGRMYWRYTERSQSMYGPLDYQDRGNGII